MYDQFFKTLKKNFFILWFFCLHRTNSHDTGSWLRPDITCQYYDKANDIAHVWIDWARFDTPHHVKATEKAHENTEANDELKENEANSNHSNSTENVVLVTSNKKFDNYLQLYHPTTPYMHLKLKPDLWYKVKVRSCSFVFSKFKNYF